MRQLLRGASEWVKQNVALVVALDVVLSLGLFGVIQTQVSQINANSAKTDCWSHVLDQAVSHAPLKAPTRAMLEDEARACASLP